MSDTMRFTPSEVAVRRGETVRFVVHNDGKAMHEIVIGTEEELPEHAERMKKHQGMVHDAPCMAHLATNATRELVWTFTRAGKGRSSSPGTEAARERPRHGRVHFHDTRHAPNEAP